MAPSLARYAWLPLVGATAWLATEEVAIYRRVYTAARYVAYRQGACVLVWGASELVPHLHVLSPPHQHRVQATMCGTQRL